MWSLSSGSFFSFFDDLKATALFIKELGLRAMSYNTYARRKNALMDGYAKEGESLACLVCLEPGCGSSSKSSFLVTFWLPSLIYEVFFSSFFSTLRDFFSYAQGHPNPNLRKSKNGTAIMSTPSCISIQDPSRRVEVLRGTTSCSDTWDACAPLSRSGGAAATLPLARKKAERKRGGQVCT